MTTVTTVPNADTARHQEILSAIKNLHTRWFFFHKEGRTTKQLKHLNNAYYKVVAKLPEQYDPKLEWKIAYEKASVQFPGGIEFVEAPTLPVFRDDYEQPEMTLENSLYDAFDVVVEEEDYDGTNILELMKEDEEMLGWQVSDTFEQHIQFMQSLSSKSKQRTKIDSLAEKLASATHSEGYYRDTYRVRQGLERLRYWGKHLKMDDPELIEKIVEALEWFEPETGLCENNDLGDLFLATLESKWNPTYKDTTEIVAQKWVEPREHISWEDHSSQSTSQDLSLQLRHQGWTFNRTATAGVGSSDHIQMLYHMKIEVFYSFLRLRKNKFPRTTIAALMKPTAYKLNEERKRVVQDHESVDNYVRMLCLARWHDEVYGTSYQEGIEEELLDTINFADQVIELAKIATQAMPNSQDQFNVDLFWKEDRFLKKHRYGYYHSKAQA